MTAPAVTIGLPFASTPWPYLELAVRSVFAQTVEDWELVLLADGSFPQLEDRLASIRDSRVRLVSDPVNRGLAARLNQVPGLAAADVVVRMDGDDLMHPLRLERTLALMTPEVDVVGGRAYAVDRDTRIVGLFREGPLPEDHAGYLASNAFTHPTVAATRQWFLDHPYDEQLKRSEDKDLWLRTADRSRFAKTDEVLLFYRLADLGAAKQGRDARHDRILLRRHGPALVGRGRTLRMVATSYSKQAAFAALAGCGGSGTILRRKAAPLADTELADARAALARVSRAPVPGW